VKTGLCSQAAIPLGSAKLRQNSDLRKSARIFIRFPALCVPPVGAGLASRWEGPLAWDNEEELAASAEGYEAELQRTGLVDFDDLVIFGERLVCGTRLVAPLLQAKLPVLAVDEYQDLGVALHPIVKRAASTAGFGSSPLATPTSPSTALRARTKHCSRSWPSAPMSSVSNFSSSIVGL
jgi:superfamily I DNA/RNA helicase